MTDAPACHQTASSRQRAASFIAPHAEASTGSELRRLVEYRFYNFPHGGPLANGPPLSVPGPWARR